MKITSLIITFILSLSIIAMSAGAAPSGVILPVYEYSSGDWDVTNEAAFGADYNDSDFAECLGVCTLIVNFTLPVDIEYYNNFLWDANISGIVNGVDPTAEPDCFASGEQFSVMIFMNATADPNVTQHCEDRTSPGTWLALDADNYDATTVSSQYIYWTDANPTTELLLPEDDSYTKECNAQQVLGLLPIVFTGTDGTDGMLSCTAYVNAIAAGTNSSVVNATETTMYVSLAEGVNNSIFVRCTDENNNSDDSETRYVQGELCGSCLNESSGDFLTYALIIIILLFMGAYLMGGVDFFARNWYIVALLIAFSLILWYLQNWNHLC